MTRPRVDAMIEQGRLDRALALVFEASDALHSAALSDDENGLELVDAVSIVGNARAHLLAAGAIPAANRELPPSLNSEEAARNADAALRQAAGIFVGGDVTEDEFLAVAEMWAAVRFLHGWL